MHRTPVLELLERYRQCFPEEQRIIGQFLTFVHRRSDCLERTCSEGHLTASGWVVDPSRSRAVLLHHKKTNRWLQPGGHADGNPDLAAVAAKEVLEETGLETRLLLTNCPLDLDVHEIGERNGVPRHFHYDVRFLLQAVDPQKLRANAESLAVRWIANEELAAVTEDESVLRLARKAVEHPIVE